MNTSVALICLLALTFTLRDVSAAGGGGADNAPAAELTFQAIGSANATRQYTMQLATGNLNSPNFTPLNCTKPAVGACTATNPPLQQDTGDLLRVVYNLASPKGASGAPKTYLDGTPTKLQLRACYTLASSVDRAWRKKNKAFPRLSQNCPRKFYEVDLTKNPEALQSGTQYMNFNEVDEIPTATWFVMMWVYCGDSVCAFESTEGNAAATPPVPGNFFETKVEMGITPGMRVAAIILSIFGPAFFISFYIFDTIHYKKTGRPFLLF